MQIPNGGGSRVSISSFLVSYYFPSLQQETGKGTHRSTSPQRLFSSSAQLGSSHPTRTKLGLLPLTQSKPVVIEELNPANNLVCYTSVGTLQNVKDDPRGEQSPK